MKIATLLIPAYLPPPYPGATPTPYQSGTTDKFERQLADLSPLVVRQQNSVRIRPDSAGRFAHAQIVTPYQVAIELNETALGDAVALALKVFSLETVTVILGDAEGEDIDAAASAELREGLHNWSEG